MSISAMKQAYAVPLIEQLESVPTDARMMYEHDKSHHQNIPVGRLCHEAAAALRQAIAEAEKQEPVVWLDNGLGAFYWAWEFNDRPVPPGFEPLYAAWPRDWSSVTDDALIEEVRYRGFTIRDAQISPKRWVGLTDEEIKALPSWWPSYDQMPALMRLVRDIEAKLKEKNSG